ncbi:MAG: tRNA (adenosine(37)-N6)-threonylcarbamoyltransferase complex dimerization subunit type 1 TsaB [Aquabacterium sp.]
MPAASPVLLSLDTATDRIHAALSQGGEVRVRDLPGGAQASSTLLPTLGALLGEAGITWQDLDAIAFGRGPGAFTGLRTACSIAQGLALALALPVIALDTLMAVAEDARQAAPDAIAPGDILWVLQDARMDELYVSAFQWLGDRWQVAQAARLWPLADVAQAWHARTPAGPGGRWAGNAAQAYPQALAGLPAPCAGTTEASPCAMPVGRALAALAQSAWQRQDTLDAALALPTYVRDKVALTTAERAAATAMKDNGQPA